jgi:hypothetical protein
MVSAAYPTFGWSPELEHCTGLDATDHALAIAVDLDTYAYVLERVNAVSDTEWELLCSFEASCEEEWTHGIFLDAAVEHTEIISPLALCNRGQEITYMCPIFYGTQESLAVHKGKVFPKRQVTAILRVLDYGLLEPSPPCLQATT